MPYLLRVLTGKAKKVTGLFAREGVELMRIPISEYLLCHDPKCTIIRFLQTIENYITNLTEISDDEADRLLTQRLVPVTKDIQVGKIVTVVEGEYRGQSGVVREINDGKIHIDVCLFGRMRQVDLETDQIALSALPEAWR
jgi:transcription antitermination factor NusG